ncbi:MAG: isoprenylcysteine carboxylmethyltransferase family protein [Chloroflexi bacterium]|nr:isoprenylcysteine carboxylmethyltransferase family protein [Chloroflexota bacterium]
MMKHLKGFILSSAWVLWIVLLITQIILSLFLYNPAGYQALRIVGWIVGAAAGLFGVLPMITLRKKGGAPKEKDYTHTTTLVDSGVYAVVRHPQYLSFMLLSLFLILVAQHWLITVIGIAAMALVYAGIVPQADQASIEKFGDKYKRYMRKVPGVNVLAGVIRLLQRGKMEGER